MKTIMKNKQSMKDGTEAPVDKPQTFKNMGNNLD
jgi:hypothetical protein